MIESIKLLRVIGINKGSQAESIGMAIGNTIIEYNDQPIHTDEELSNAIRFSKASGKHRQKLGYWHDGKRLTANLSNDPIGIVCSDDEVSIKDAISESQIHKDLSAIPKEILRRLSEKIILCTTPTLGSNATVSGHTLITAECVYGVNLFFDLFNSVRDLTGGRSKTMEKLINDAKTELLEELRHKAAVIGADAVLSIEISFSEIDGGGKTGMLMANATGTAVTF